MYGSSTTENLGDLDFDISRVFTVKSNGAVRFLIHAFLLMFNMKIWPNVAPSRALRFPNISAFDLTFRDD